MPEAALRVDVNGGWSLARAVEELEELSSFGLEYAEQNGSQFEGHGWRCGHWSMSRWLLTN